MKEEDFDKLFKDSIENVELDTDSNEIWNNITQHKRKKRRFIYWIWLLGFVVIISSAFTIYFNWNTDPADPVKTKNASILQARNLIKDTLHGWNQIQKNKYKLEKQELPQKKAEHDILLNTFTKNHYVHSKKLNIDKKPIEELRIKGNTINGMNDYGKISTMSHAPQKSLHDRYNYENNLIATQHIQKVYSSRKHLNLDVNVELDTIKQILSLNSQEFERNRFGINLSYGVGSFYTELSTKNINTSTKSSRIAAEKNRFVSQCNMSLDYYIKPKLAISGIINYQTFYSYFQDSIQFNSYENQDFVISEYATTRYISSNIIYDQIQFGLLVKYNHYWNKMGIELGSGLLYSLFTQAKGKTYDNAEIIELQNFDLSRSNNMSISTSFHLLFPLHEKWNIRTGIEGFYQVNNMLETTDITQRNHAVIYGVGISYLW